ncbi:hypothetical protein H0A36_09720 [Endozoicomonas sp. SM1973]|uniref:Uncharacterized protein n=1 Tax=Spartinivicinus marinus TaxID=2994442 RepID=A0A853I0Z4_9GAMM|nr:hypothetical protein [Spartinivicinus marinus]MCX4024684.1 hypothetical protein [Spartinivicinus marinus]NYZ66289.1 hypothetical protein [Spartinivicinus marinus]
MSELDFELWLEFEEWNDEYNEVCEYFNMHVKLKNGNVYALNVWTKKVLEDSLQEDFEQSGLKYLLLPDLVVDKANRDYLEKVVFRLISNEEMKESWLIGDDS